MRNSKSILAIVLTLASAAAQSNTARTTFEVASVRQHEGTDIRSGPLTVSGPLIRLRGYTIYGLLIDAWNVKTYQLKISPAIPKEDIYGNMYDIVARAPGAATPKLQDVRVMLQNLLADRFKVQVHHEAKEMPVYALTIARGGSKLKPSTAAGQCSVHVALASDGRNSDEVFSACPVEELADSLGNLIGTRPVLDQTGLKGRYDFRLVATPESRSRNQSDPADIDPITAVADLGLKLTPQQAPVEILVVDHLEKLIAN